VSLVRIRIVDPYGNPKSGAASHVLMMPTYYRVWYRHNGKVESITFRDHVAALSFALTIADQLAISRQREYARGTHI
jgi:hypothetical protein